MNPFVYPEFWLSLAFFIVLGMIILPPVRQKMNSFLAQAQQKIQDQMKESASVLQQAKQAYHQAQKALKEKPLQNDFQNQKLQIQQEFAQKTQDGIEKKKQDFQMRQNLILAQTKHHVRTELLDKAEEKILNLSPHKKMDKEVKHFIKMLDENQEALKKSL